MKIIFSDTSIYIRVFEKIPFAFLKLSIIDEDQSINQSIENVKNKRK